MPHSEQVIRRKCNLEKGLFYPFLVSEFHHQTSNGAGPWPAFKKRGRMSRHPQGGPRPCSFVGFGPRFHIRWTSSRTIT